MGDREQRYRQIQERIERALSLRSSRELTLVAVSKAQPVEAIRELYHLGQRDFGENYVQELLSKVEELRRLGDCADIRWHFIGHLQSNKVKALLGCVQAIHSIDSLRLAQEVSKRWLAMPGGTPETRLPIFIEVNIDQETSKSGVLPDDAVALATQVGALPGLELRGLMCVPSIDRSEQAFARLRELELWCRPHTQGGLSMGMSDDFEEAIRQGATHIRVGTSLFGARSYPRAVQ